MKGTHWARLPDVVVIAAGLIVSSVVSAFNQVVVYDILTLLIGVAIGPAPLFWLGVWFARSDARAV